MLCRAFAPTAVLYVWATPRWPRTRAKKKRNGAFMHVPPAAPHSAGSNLLELSRDRLVRKRGSAHSFETATTRHTGQHRAVTRAPSITGADAPEQDHVLPFWPGPCARRVPSACNAGDSG